MAPASAGEWMTDFPATMQQAKAENKLVLVDFTGSDCCSACILLRRNVLDNADFRVYAADKFVLMEVDLPQRHRLAPELRQQNEALAKRYGVAAFPTILVLNPQGEVLGGFQEGDKSVKEAIQQLEEAYMVDALYRKAAMQSGVGSASAPSMPRVRAGGSSKGMWCIVAPGKQGQRCAALSHTVTTSSQSCAGNSSVVLL